MEIKYSRETQFELCVPVTQARIQVFLSVDLLISSCPQTVTTLIQMAAKSITPSALFVLVLHLHPSEVSVYIYLYMNSRQDLSVSNAEKKIHVPAFLM